MYVEGTVESAIVPRLYSLVEQPPYSDYQNN